MSRRGEEERENAEKALSLNVASRIYLQHWIGKRVSAIYDVDDSHYILLVP